MATLAHDVCRRRGAVEDWQEVRMVKCCPTCHRPLPENIRYGVALGPIKLRIFDLIEKRPGVTTKEIASIIYESAHEKSTINVHVGQINDLFADTDLRIIGKQYSGYRMVVPRGLKR